MQKVKNLLFSVIVLGLFMSSCKEKAAETSTETSVTTPEVKKVTLTDFPVSVAFADAKLNGYTYKKGKFDFTLGKSDYELGVQSSDANTKMCANSDKGQHIHLLLDDKPYSAQYSNAFEFPIEDGEHTILAFLSRSYHESIKNGSASIAKKIVVKGGSKVSDSNITTPMIWHSRPKGVYVGKDTEKVMLDFFIQNVSLGEEYKVKAQIDDNEFIINTWQPYFLENLAMGDHSVTLTLIDKDGKTVEVANNPAKGSFTLKADELNK